MAYECVAGAHAAVIVTDWNIFRALDLDRVKTAMAPFSSTFRNVYRAEQVRTKAFISVDVRRDMALRRPGKRRALIKQGSTAPACAGTLVVTGGTGSMRECISLRPTIETVASRDIPAAVIWLSSFAGKLGRSRLAPHTSFKSKCANQFADQINVVEVRSFLPS